jgi:hypothetical protein
MTDIDRRSALKSLGALAAAIGITVQPITARDATDAVLLVLTCRNPLTAHGVERLRETLTAGLKGTPLEHVRIVVLPDDLKLELINLPKGHSIP